MLYIGEKFLNLGFLVIGLYFTFRADGPMLGVLAALDLILIYLLVDGDKFLRRKSRVSSSTVANTRKNLGSPRSHQGTLNREDVHAIAKAQMSQEAKFRVAIFKPTGFQSELTIIDQIIETTSVRGKRMIVADFHRAQNSRLTLAKELEKGCSIEKLQVSKVNNNTDLIPYRGPIYSVLLQRFIHLCLEMSLKYDEIVFVCEPVEAGFWNELCEQLNKNLDSQAQLQREVPEYNIESGTLIN